MPRVSDDKYCQRTPDCCSGVYESGNLIDSTIGSHENFPGCTAPIALNLLLDQITRLERRFDYR